MYTNRLMDSPNSLFWIECMRTHWNFIQKGSMICKGVSFFFLSFSSSIWVFYVLLPFSIIQEINKEINCFIKRIFFIHSWKFFSETIMLSYTFALAIIRFYPLRWILLAPLTLDFRQMQFELCLIADITSWTVFRSEFFDFS